MAMNTCLLCLQAHTEFNNYIPLNSSQWFELKIRTKIEAHFWPIDNVQNVLGICYFCWSKLNDFHEFYTTIEEAHCREFKVSLEEDKSGNDCSSEMEMLQLNTPQIFKADFTAAEDTNFTIDEFDGDIKIEETFNENESLLCINTTNVHDKVNCNPISIEKRKRGRPPKKFNANELIIKKPKGKRGRPRKYVSDVDDSHKNMPFRNDSTSIYKKAVNRQQQLNYTNESQTSQQAGIVKTNKRGRPPKVKRSRGRPRKIQLNEESSNTTTAVNDVEIPDVDVGIGAQCPTSPEEEVTNEVPSNINVADKLVHKKYKLSSLLKRRKRTQQHKALMRNYIATSMRCMKFFKK